MIARASVIVALLACACVAHGETRNHTVKAPASARAPHAASAASPASSAPEGAQGDAKEVSGMSIVGNSEAPKSLTIIPWKSSEIGRDADFKSTLLSQDIVPIDKPTFLRGLAFHEASTRPQGH